MASQEAARAYKEPGCLCGAEAVLLSRAPGEAITRAITETVDGTTITVKGQ